ncbi:MAG: preprotein translocase subunit SecG [Chitinispirillia bacterium]|jgi:preprotein translocase subunit SecG
MLFGIAVVIFLIVCVGLILLVLIQSDKGGGISGAIGGGLSGASNVLGAQDTANILTKGTTIFAVTYMVLCILLSLFMTKTAVSQSKSDLKKRAESQSFSPASVLQGGSALPTNETESSNKEDALPELPGE